MTNSKTTTNIRELVLEILIDVMENGNYSHLAIRGVLTKYQYLEKQDRAFLSRLSEGTIERMIELDYIINQFSSVKVKKMKPVIRNIIRMSVYQIKYMNQVPDSAACNEAVKLAKKKGFKTLTGFVNGVLRNISRGLSTITYPDEKKELVFFLSIKYSVPEWIIEKWIKEYDAATVVKILDYGMEQKGTTIRCCLEKTSVAELKEKLEKEDITVQEGAYLEYALKISNYNYINQISAFKEELFQVQDESSMLVCEIAGIKENDVILDVCAAPGGKSLHAAEKLKQTGFVMARDISQDKIAYMQENFKRLKMNNMKAMVWDALELDEENVEKADVVLADLPCSGLGVIGKKTDIKYKMTAQAQQDLVQLQRDILNVIWKYVKKDGVLIYSTCTINQEENIENVKWFMSQYDFELESIDSYLPAALHSQTTKEGYLQLLPGIHETDGFFIARLKRR